MAPAPPDEGDPATQEHPAQAPREQAEKVPHEHDEEATSADPDDDEWYLAVDGEQQGPMELPALRERLAAQPSRAEVYVWREGMDDWKEPDEISMLRTAGPLVQDELMHEGLFDDILPHSAAEEDVSVTTRPSRKEKSELSLLIEGLARTDEQLDEAIAAAQAQAPRRPLFPAETVASGSHSVETSAPARTPRRREAPVRRGNKGLVLMVACAVALGIGGALFLGLWSDPPADAQVEPDGVEEALPTPAKVAAPPAPARPAKEPTKKTVSVAVQVERLERYLAKNRSKLTQKRAAIIDMHIKALKKSMGLEPGGAPAK